MTSIGWYVHHHGGGHRARFLAIRRRLDADVTCFSSLSAPATLPPRTTWIVLDRDDSPTSLADGTVRLPADSDPSAAGALHWAPLQNDGHRERLATIAAVAARSRFDAFVVDVSVEVTLLVRLLGIPVVVVAQPGDRSDEPHRTAYRAATRIVAPWPRGLVAAPHLDGVRDVVYTGGISRFEGRGVESGDEDPGRPGDEDPGVRDGAGPRVLLLQGRGGSDVALAAVVEARSAVPSSVWTILGAGGRWSEDPWAELVRADVVVSWAGQNSIADLATVGAKAVVIPQQRPFDEQVVTARAIADASLALVEWNWPPADRWPALLDLAVEQRPDWLAWRTAGAAGRAADAIADVARRWPA